MNATKAEPEARGPAEICSIVVLYDNNTHRARALAACDSLMRQLWQEVELKFHWWRTDFLLDSQLAQLAADDAAAADILIVCTEQTPASMPVLESWLEQWLDRRGETSGALINLLPTSAVSGPPQSQETLLEEICRRGNFDYLTTINENPLRHSSEKTSSARARPPSHYGLNE